METSRIPVLADKSFDGMLQWFSQMSVEGLLFHPDEDPADMIVVTTNKPVFAEGEIPVVRSILDEMFARHGDDVYEAAYPITMKAFGIRLDA